MCDWAIKRFASRWRQETAGNLFKKMTVLPVSDKLLPSKQYVMTVWFCFFTYKIFNIGFVFPCLKRGETSLDLMHTFNNLK